MTVTINGPLVVGFFPPYSQREADSDEVIEGLAHVQFALEDIEKCLQRKEAVYRLEVTRAITLRDGKQVRRITIPSDGDRSVGLVFATPGRNPRVVYATAGPVSLGGAGTVSGGRVFLRAWLPDRVRQAHLKVRLYEGRAA